MLKIIAARKVPIKKCVGDTLPGELFKYAESVYMRIVCDTPDLAAGKISILNLTTFEVLWWEPTTIALSLEGDLTWRLAQ